MDNLNNQPLEVLAQLWMSIKSKKKELDSQLLDVEKAMMENIQVPEEGSKTTNVEGYKIVAKGVVNRRLDVDKWDEIREQIPEALRPVKYKPSLDEAGVKWLRNNEPEIYTTLAGCITSKPGKTGFTITKVEE